MITVYEPDYPVVADAAHALAGVPGPEQAHGPLLVDAVRDVRRVEVAARLGTPGPMSGS